MQYEKAESKAEIKSSTIPTKKSSTNKISNPENHTENEPEIVNLDINPPQGKVYVEGFGYVEDSGHAQGKIVHSDGNINKMVGIMDSDKKLSHLQNDVRAF